MDKFKIVLVVCVLAGNSVQAQEPPAMDPAPEIGAVDTVEQHEARAQALMQAERYQEALAELEAAYQLRQSPRLLRELAVAHRRLGHSREALDLNQRYLAADQSVDQATRASVMREVAELRALCEPAPAVGMTNLPPNVSLVPVHFEERHNRGLIAGGVTLLATGYAAAFITGSIFAAIGSNDSGYNSSSDGSLAAGGGTLLIPVLGPFISAFTFREVAWSVPWALIDGTAQVAGLAMIIAGARQKHKVPVFGKVDILPYGGANGGGLMVSGRF
jgi:hypothetical protein